MRPRKAIPRAKEVTKESASSIKLSEEEAAERVKAYNALTNKQRAFCDHYTRSGNAMEAALYAGYTERSARINHGRILQRPEVARYLSLLTAHVPEEQIASLVELRSFWTTAMRDEEGDMRERLKASELLGRSLAAFVERREQTGGLHIKVTYGDDE